MSELTQQQIIDLFKDAPEDATHYGFATDTKSEGWYKINENLSYQFMNIDAERWFGNVRITKLSSNGFGELLARPKAPIFTQAMCDAGTLPSVGMECLIVHCSSTKAIIIAITLQHVIVIEGKNTSEVHYCIEEVMLLPLTPPIELIDGEAYQFTFTKTNFTGKGIYNLASETLQLAMHQVNVCDCTNIKLLEVKS